MPKKQLALEIPEQGGSDASPNPARAVVWSGAALDFHRVPSGGGHSSVGQRLGEAAILLKQEPDTPAGHMILYREGTYEELGPFTAEGALHQLTLGFQSTRKKGRKAEG